MSMNKMSALGGAMAIMMLIHLAEAQTVYRVGDSGGWTVPPDNSIYQEWASDKSFSVADILTFNFQTGEHDVIEVSQESYSSCSSTNPIGRTYSTGPTNITLDSGEHYYICGIGRHCANGQRLAINVSGSPSPSACPPSSAIPPPSSSAPTSFPSFIISLLFLFAFMIIARS